jgi:Rrf2 family protein
MKLTMKGRYGLRAMLDLALYGVDNKVSLKSISERQHIPENYLEQIIAVLKKAGLVNSSRGACGGYSLKKTTDEISVGDILRVLEGSLDPVDCATINEEKQCDSYDSCVTKLVWKKISDSINETVNNISLQDLVDEQGTITSENKSIIKTINC